MKEASLLFDPRQKFLVELIWWTVTTLLVLLILFPINSATEKYPFYLINAIFIIVFITTSRYIFFLKYTFLAWRQYLKIILAFLSIILVFNLVNNLNYFITFIDENSYSPFLGHLSDADQIKMETYIRTEMLLFGVGSIVSSAIFPFRMVLSVWRVRNRNTV